MKENPANLLIGTTERLEDGIIRRVFMHMMQVGMRYMD